jgi:RNA polymerase sigma-70 factor (ECF subfamily)
MPAASLRVESARAEADAATIERARLGDEGARRVLVERYERPVFALLHRFVGAHRREDVEDMAQETFLRVFRELGAFRTDGRARLSTWILTIATRLAIDGRRRDAVRRRHVPLSPVPPAMPDRASERAALGRRIADAVAELDDGYRAAFLLHAYHELSYAEIADALGCGVGTAKSRVSRAKQRLREALRESSDE